MTAELIAAVDRVAARCARLQTDALGVGAREGAAGHSQADEGGDEGSVPEGALRPAVLRHQLLTAAPSGEPDATQHPLVRLADAYAAAFTAVVRSHRALRELGPRPLPWGAQELADLARRAAAELPRALDLVYGQRRLGTAALVCEHVAALEDQADKVRLDALRELLGADRPGEQRTGWTPALAADIQLLAALEAVTDTCEDIAEHLLVVQCVIS